MYSLFLISDSDHQEKRPRYLLILLPVVGTEVGRSKNTSSTMANMTTVALHIQPNQLGKRNHRSVARNLSLLPLHISRKQGIAKEIIAKMIVVLINALNAAVDARYMQPAMNTTPALASRDHTGTCSAICILARCLEHTSPLSRPNAQMRWEEVCCTALMTKKTMVRRATRKAVAAAPLPVACRQSS
jgi:hypothetical protein